MVLAKYFRIKHGLVIKVSLAQCFKHFFKRACHLSIFNHFSKTFHPDIFKERNFNQNSFLIFASHATSYLFNFIAQFFLNLIPQRIDIFTKLMLLQIIKHNNREIIYH